MGDWSVYDEAARIHDEVRSWDQRGVTSRTVFEAFARTMNQFNDAQVRMGLPVLALQDPRYLIAHIHGLASQMVHVEPSMGTVESLGAQVLALALSIARVEDSRLELGDAAA